MNVSFSRLCIMWNESFSNFSTRFLVLRFLHTNIRPRVRTHWTRVSLFFHYSHLTIQDCDPLAIYKISILSGNILSVTIPSVHESKSKIKHIEMKRRFHWSQGRIFKHKRNISCPKSGSLVRVFTPAKLKSLWRNFLKGTKRGRYFPVRIHNNMKFYCHLFYSSILGLTNRPGALLHFTNHENFLDFIYKSRNFLFFSYFLARQKMYALFDELNIRRSRIRNRGVLIC